MSSGFTYVATGDAFKQEAIVSCRSLKQHMPDAHVTIFTHSKEGLVTDLFDDVQLINEPKYSFFDKIHAFLNSPYERTVFIDTDTFVCNPVDELFEVLDRFDIAAVRDHWTGTKDEGPICIDDFNTGLIVYKKCACTQAVFEDWKNIYTQQLESDLPVEHDQPSFRSAVYRNTEVKLYVLPKSYNIRLTAPIFLGVNYLPKVLHGRPPNFEPIAAKLSSSNDFRFYLTDGTLVDRTQIKVLDTRYGLPFNILTSIGRYITKCLRWIRNIG